jgi:hypothetical protein
LADDDVDKAVCRVAFVGDVAMAPAQGLEPEYEPQGARNSLRCCLRGNLSFYITTNQRKKLRWMV